MPKDDTHSSPPAAGELGGGAFAAAPAPNPVASSEQRSAILDRVRHYYSEKLERHGATHHGVDWSSRESHVTRFRELLRIVEDSSARFTLNDYGCGYGALVEELDRCDYDFEYRGFDLSEEMVHRADELYGDRDHCSFTTRPEDLTTADYTLASGIFNVKLDIDVDLWSDYVRATIHELARLSRNGFAFNVLTSYVDPGHGRDELFYADPTGLFEYCKSYLSRWVALLHDYGLYEFTLLVRRDERIPWRD